MLQDLLCDLRYGLRVMLRSPGFTGVAVLTMALGIGANTAVFSLVQGVLLEPLPYPEADRVVLLNENNLSAGFETFSIAPLNYWDWEKRIHSMELMAAYQGTSVNHTGGSRPETLSAYRVTDAYLKILGGTPALGRGIAARDLDPGGENVVVLTHGFWQRGFGGDPNILARTMVLDGVVHTVVGVVPAVWRSPSTSNPDLILPLKPSPGWYTNRGSHFLRAMGRLKPGVTLAQARSEFSAVASALAAEHPDSNTGWGAVVRPLGEVMLGSSRPQLLIFMASVGLVLLIACANLANMTLARAAGRTRELAIRTAVGAWGGRIVRQLLTESVLLAATGGVLGVALAFAAIRGLRAGWPTILPRMDEVGINATVLLFSAGVSAAAGVLFGLVPAWSVTRSGWSGLLRLGGRSLAGDRTPRWTRAGLVVGEVGLAVVLLVGTGLLVRSFSALESENPGFLAKDRLVLSTPLPAAKYPAQVELRAFADAALARMRAVPGVGSVALASLVPLEGSDEIWSFWVQGRKPPGGEADGVALFYRVSPGYFQTMGIPWRAGRDITDADREGGHAVVVVSASLGEKFFPGESPLGKHIRFGRDEDAPPVEIVGVVGDVQHYDLGQTSMPQAYVPYRQRPTRDISFVIKASTTPLGLVDEVRGAVMAVDPDQPLVNVQTLEAMVSGTISTPRFRTLLMTGFGLTALLLAVVGLYGVMACSVSRRTKEIGVRIALGATRGSVLALVLREGGSLLGIGMVVGLGGAFALSRILESMLFGVGARDPAVFAAVPLVLSAVAAMAMLIPAHRATRVDPVRTLGEE